MRIDLKDLRAGIAIVRDEGGNIVRFLSEVDTDEGWAMQYQKKGPLRREGTEGNYTESQDYEPVKIFGKFTVTFP